jgi:hypothetical protein
MACRLQIGADPDPAYHFDADPYFQINADPDRQQCRTAKYFHEKKKNYLVILKAVSSLIKTRYFAWRRKQNTAQKHKNRKKVS